MELPPSNHASPSDTVLETVLGAYRMRVEIMADVHYCGTWLDEEPSTRFGQFHLVTEGRCWVAGEAMDAPVPLEAGDLIVFPGGIRHQLQSSANPRDEDAARAPDTWMLCGELEFITGSHNPIFQALPTWFVIRAADSSAGFRELAEMLAIASRDRGWGRRLIQNKLADSLFTMAICEYVRRAAQPQGLLAALADARLSRVLAEVHHQPGQEWTLATMAQLAGMSRTAFSELFTATVGMPPIQYLAHWRATEARRLLRNRRFSVARVAEMLGYSSEAAFRRFFKRLEGVGPGKVRGGHDAG
ncbi:AraC family transcriptional regulator [Stenotrophomonas sp. HITSZ_GD]|uniref:AraC family transcriptional regulator n=1 Tax=Stenotrophomonas sp. HITSZ_GD TaxID=3037248 RepID=UPI00240DCB0F|nr:AraC family transcriptional regulator [Stenotrophomonas sp. HITSZ_GD]MDG2523963.1 AraC family transcriptional regulator [Stenotrophomonas sp. HITSZ_GD]